MSQTSFVQFSHENVIENLQGVGISLGSNSDQISRTVDRSKKMEIERTIATKSNDTFSEVFDKVEKRNWIMRK
jgi:conjugal transfer/entry exclusion protein